MHESVFPTFRPRPSAQDPRVYADLSRLVALQYRARDFSFLPRQPVHSILSGRHASRVRGRGLNFEEIRAYRPGDDVRSIDWKVTARMRSPHTRVFTEERDRPVLLLVDQRIAMFFGTRLYMKSVTAAEAAALGAWRVLAAGDRVGGLVFNDERIDEIRPQRSRPTVARLLESVVAMNHALHAQLQTDANPAMLNRALHQALRLAGHDYLVVVVSDFDGADKETEQLLTKLAQHNDVLGVLVHDPAASQLPPSSDIVVSDGELQVELALGSNKTLHAITEYASGRIARVLAWQHDLGVPILPLNTGEEVAPQLQRLLGFQPRT